MPSSSPQRKYALHKVAKGDYLLLSNDGLTMWRLVRYQDGPSYGLEDEPRDQWFWQVLRWPKPMEQGKRLDKFDMSDLWHWNAYALNLGTRAEAIDVALKAGA
jgi:hypothetical protein